MGRVMGGGAVVAGIETAYKHTLAFTKGKQEGRGRSNEMGNAILNKQTALAPDITEGRSQPTGRATGWA